MSQSSGTVYPQEVWDEEHVRDVFEVADTSDQVRRWVDSQTRGLSGPTVRSLEIGCFPGRYLAYFGERGFEINGIDLTPRVEPEMRDWLKHRGYRVGRIERGDFFAFQDSVGFDLVLSNGFIEHFEDWKSCLHRHLDLVRPGGRLFLATPNFVGGVQNYLHRRFDRENFDRHFLPAMDIDAWAAIARERGFEIEYSGYFSEFDFWNGPQERPIWQRAVARSIRVLLPALRTLVPPNHRSTAPYCGMVARKK